MATAAATSTDALSSSRASVPWDITAAACFFCSGVFALMFEVCWIRKAALVFGATTFALSTVLSVFFAGLAAGSYVFGRWTRRWQRPLRVYGFVEIGVGLLAGLSPWAFVGAELAYHALYGMIGSSFGWLTVARALLVLAIIFPPAFLMGGTLPVLSRHFVRSEARISLSVGLLYAINTLGAALGTALAGFFLIPGLGVNRTLLSGAVLNMLVGTLMALAPASTGQTASEQDRDQSRRAPPAPEPPGRRWIIVVGALFFFTGFVALANEILWTRFLSLLIKNTVYTYTLTLTIILVGIVAGSALTAGWFDRLRQRALAFGAVQFLYGITVLALLRLPPRLWWSIVDERSVVSQALAVSAVLLVPSILSGISFPLAIRMVLAAPQDAGPVVGRMTALNIVGGIAGSLTAGFVILPVAGMHATLLLTTGLAMAVGITAWLTLDDTLAKMQRWGLALCSVSFALLVLRSSDTTLPRDFLTRGDELVDYQEGISCHMAVLRRDDRIRLEIDRLWQGEASLSGQDPDRHQVVAAHLPMLLRPEARDVLVVGLGTGRTAGRFLYYPVRQLDCVDIEPELVPFVRRHFRSDWMDDPRARFIVDDGRNYLAHSRRTYDVISLEVGQVFRPGLAAFYSLDFYERARRRLNDGGIVCQFVPLSAFDPHDFRMVVRTFMEVFPESQLWYNTSELLLIGTAADRIGLTSQSLPVLETNERVRRDLDFAYWGGTSHRLNRPEVLLASFLMGPPGLRDLSQGAPIYRDDLPVLEYTTAKRSTSVEDEHVPKLRIHLDPIELAFDAPQVDAAEVSAIQMRKLNIDVAAINKIRLLNLNDMIASGIQRYVEELADAGQLDEARAQLSKALRYNPQSRGSYRNLGQILARQQQWEAAWEAFQKALAIDPEDPVVHAAAGSALLSLRRIDDAVVHFQRALELRPDHAQAHTSLGVIMASRGDTGQAMVHFRRTLQTDPDSAEAHNNIGMLLIARREFQEALHHFDRALEAEPLSAEIYFNRGRALSGLGRGRQAMEAWQESAQLKPGWPSPWDAMARLLASQTEPTADQAERAVALAEKAVQLSDRTRWRYLDTLGAAYAAAGRFTQAVSAAEQAARYADAEGRTAAAAASRKRADVYRQQRRFDGP